MVSIDKITESSSADAAKVKKSQSDSSQKCDLKTGDRVMVQTKYDELVQGTVKFVGSHEKNPQPGPLVGIELVSIYGVLVCVYASVYVCMCVHMYICVYVGGCECMCIYVCIYVCIHMYVCAYVT